MGHGSQTNPKADRGSNGLINLQMALPLQQNTPLRIEKEARRIDSKSKFGKFDLCLTGRLSTAARSAPMFAIYNIGLCGHLT